MMTSLCLMKTSTKMNESDCNKLDLKYIVGFLDMSYEWEK